MLQDRIELLFSLKRKLLSLNRIESSAHDSFCSDFDYTPSPCITRFPLTRILAYVRASGGIPR